MTGRKVGMLRASLGALALSAVMAAPSTSLAAPPAPTPVTPDLIAAAKQEGKVVFYTAIDLKVAEALAKRFEAQYGIKVQVERTGSERVFQRVQQERASRIYAADVLDGSDQALFITWKREGVLEPYVPEDAAKWPADMRDPDGAYVATRYTLMPIGYNTNLVKAEDAPKSFADLLDPKWTGKIVKAHPGYSGGIVTSTFQVARALGWGYFEKLGKQKVMQIQSSTEPPKKLALGERAVSADGLEYMHITLKEAGSPIGIVYPTEGTPIIPGCSGIAKNAPHPNAAKLYMNFLASRDTQQFLHDSAGLRSYHPGVTEKAGRVPLSQIKTMAPDAEAQELATEDIKRKYTAAFGI